MEQNAQSKFGLLTEYDVKEAVEKGLESVKGKWHAPDRQDFECVRHSISKWQGAQAPGANLRYRDHNIVAPRADGDVALLQFDSDSCALCRLQKARCNGLTDFCDGTSDGRIKPCPFVREFGHRCDDESHDIVNIYAWSRRLSGSSNWWKRK